MEGWVGYQVRMRFGSLASTLCPFISLLRVNKVGVNRWWWLLLLLLLFGWGGEVALEVVSFLGQNESPLLRQQLGLLSLSPHQWGKNPKTKVCYPKFHPRIWMDGWMDGWIDGWMDGQMDGWKLCPFWQNESPLSRQQVIGNRVKSQKIACCPKFYSRPLYIGMDGWVIDGWSCVSFGIKLDESFFFSHLQHFILGFL